MRKIIAGLILVMGFTISFGIVYADIIPGVDEPFNPAAYYSPTAISYEDSPSVFTMRDLARQGGSVFDYTRHLKQLAIETNTNSWLKKVFEALGVEITDSSPINPNIIIATKKDLDELNENTVNAWKTSETYKFMGSENFRDFDKYDNDGTKDYDELKQAEELEEIYKSYAEILDEIKKMQEKEEGLIQHIQEASHTAKGEMELSQLQAQLEAIQFAENKRKNMLLGTYAELKNIENRLKSDETLRRYRKYYNSELMISDPFDRTELAKKQYEKALGIGFVEMK